MSATDSSSSLSLLRMIGRKIRHVVFRTTCSLWFEKSLEEAEGPVFPAERIEVEFMVEDKSRLVAWLREHHSEFPWIYFPEEIESAEANGHIFTALRDGKEIIGYLKVGVGRTYIHDFRRTISFPKDIAFIYDTFVLPERRGKGAALYGVAKTMEYLRERGFKRVWCHIEEWNNASLRLYKKKGFIPRGHLRASWIFGIMIYTGGGCRLLPGPEALIGECGG